MLDTHVPHNAIVGALSTTMFSRSSLFQEKVMPRTRVISISTAASKSKATFLIVLIEAFLYICAESYPIESVNMFRMPTNVHFTATDWTLLLSCHLLKIHIVSG